MITTTYQPHSSAEDEQKPKFQVSTANEGRLWDHFYMIIHYITHQNKNNKKHEQQKLK